VTSADDDLCDDGAFCNGFETCDPTAGCQLGTAVTCDDGIECTADQCREDIKACGGFAQPELCDDLVFCNGSEICDFVQGCIPGPLPCEDGVSCSQDVCIEEQFSCEWIPVDALCDDGSFCNGAETCAAFTGCLVGAPPCTLDESCDEGQNQCTLSCVTAPNVEHVGAGRARLELETAYLAVGSDDFLGLGAADVTSLSGGGDFWERVDSCTVAPSIDSFAVQVIGNVISITGTASDANGNLAQVIVTVDVSGVPLQVPAQGTDEFTAVLSGLFPGTYVAFAQPFDTTGLAGEPSAPVLFTVLQPLPPTIDSVEADTSGGVPVIRGTASDPNDDIERIVVTVRQGGSVIASVEASGVDPFSASFPGLPAGSYTARAQAADASGLASAPSTEVSFTVVEGSAAQCITATNTQHQAEGRATALFGDTFFFAVGSNDFLGVAGSTVTSLAGSGATWEEQAVCSPPASFPSERLVTAPVVVLPREP
jgi:hypothetical protein